MKELKTCMVFAFGAVATIAIALLFSRVFCRRNNRIGEKTEQLAESVKENIKETINEAAQAIEQGAEMVEGALKKARK